MALNQSTEETLYQDMLLHVGHQIVMVTYGEPVEDPIAVSLECETCGEVLMSTEGCVVENFEVD